MTTALTVRDNSLTKSQHIRKWIQRLGFVFLILSPLVFIVAALGYRFGFWGLGVAFGTLTQKIGPLALLITLILGVAGLLLGFILKPRKGIIISLLAILVPAAGMFHAKSVTNTARTLPFIHDITTDTQNPPVFTSAILSQRAKTKGVNTVDYAGKLDRPDGTLVSVLQVKGYPDIRPVILEDAPDVAFGRAKAAVSAMGWTVAAEDAGTGLIEATDTTFWYGFKDDVVVRVMPSEGGGSVVDIRSVSRIGKSDIGANAERIRKFIKTIRG